MYSCATVSAYNAQAKRQHDAAMQTMTAELAAAHDATASRVAATQRQLQVTIDCLTAQLESQSAAHARHLDDRLADERKAAQAELAAVRERADHRVRQACAEADARAASAMEEVRRSAAVAVEEARRMESEAAKEAAARAAATHAKSLEEALDRCVPVWAVSCTL